MRMGDTHEASASPKANRYALVGVSLVVQLCLGGLFAWSEFVPHLVARYGLTMAQTQSVFGVTVATFTLSMVLAGRILQRHGPRLPMAVGGLLLGASYIGASYSGGRFWPILATSGLLGGAGIGLCYLCPLTVSVGMFPARKGAVTGLVVGAFGGGAIALSNAVRPYLAAGVDVLTVMRGVGIVYALVVGLCALALSPRPAPPPCSSPAGPTGGLLRQPALWLHAVGMFCGTFAGLMVIGNVKPMALAAGADDLHASLAISAMGVGNAVGRIGWGALADRIGWRSIPLSLALLAVAVALLPAASGHGSLFTLVTVLVAVGFGACFVLHAAQIAARWGAGALATAYPLVFLAYGLAGLAGPPVGGGVFDATGSYAGAVMLASGIAAVGALASCGLRACPPPEGNPE